MSASKPINVTKSRLPDSGIFSKYCEDIFQRGWLTNNGHYVRELEAALASWLDVKHLLSCSNGTMAIMLALQCAGLAGKKIALTPYTYVATLSALLWLGCEPVFVDIDPDTLCLSPGKLRRQFLENPDIAGVLPVHIYGQACDVDALSQIGAEFGAPVIYDAAQAFGSEFKGKSLLDYGDYSICSFHATKIFHTTEGGCIVTSTEANLRALALARAFGHINDDHYSLGINGKMSELHAAMGLCMLPGVKDEIAARKKIKQLYDEALAGLPLQTPRQQDGLNWNCAYYPILLPDGASRARTQKKLSGQEIYSRRYFYPSLNTLPYLKPETRIPCPIAEDASSRVLCLPMRNDLDKATIHEIRDIIAAAL